jgi:hypothetical protein
MSGEAMSNPTGENEAVAAAASVSAARSPKHARIFVQIAAYRDPDCQYTVQDLFLKAAHPERISVGICWQTVRDEDACCFQVPCPRPEQLRVIEVDARESRGVCWARSMAQTLHRDEEFTLQIDSHMRFEQDWDRLLFEMWLQCGNERAVLTSYPPGFTPPDSLQTDWIYGLAAKQFDAHGIFLMAGRPAFSTRSLPDKPIPGAFASACQLFGPATMIRDVPYDPYLYFFGEEITVTVRLWTHGYDLYHPNRRVVFHDWDRSKRPTHFSDHKDWGRANDLSHRRTRHLLGTEHTDDPEALRDLERFGLGARRTLAAYQAHSGVDFAARTISESALEGRFAAPETSSLVHPGVAPRGSMVSGAPAVIPDLRHRPRKVHHAAEAVIFDDFLPDAVFERLHAFCVKTDYEHINTKGPISRAWHVHDGFPLRSTLNAFRYSDGVEAPGGAHVYPTGTDLDAFLDALLEIGPEVASVTGEQGKDWAHVSATAWLYPPGSGLSMHDDGSGVYSGAYVYFMNPEWRLHWGGLLLLMEGEGNRLLYEHRAEVDQIDFYRRKWLHMNQMDALLMEHGFARCIFPKRNRIVFIANNAYHMVTRVNEAAGDHLRMSIAGFYNRKK